MVNILCLLDEEISLELFNLSFLLRFIFSFRPWESLWVTEHTRKKPKKISYGETCLQIWLWTLQKGLDPWIVEDRTRESAFRPPKGELEPETERNSVMGDTVCLSCRCWRFEVTYNTCVCANTDTFILHSSPQILCSGTLTISPPSMTEFCIWAFIALWEEQYFSF